MRKYFLLSSITALILLIIGTVGLIISGEVFNSNFISINGINSFREPIYSSKEIEVNNELFNFKLDLPNTKLNIYTGDSNKILIKASYFDEDNSYIIKEEENTITVERNDSKTMNFFNFGNEGGVVEVIIPKYLVADYKVYATNGSIEIVGVKAENITIETTNGNFEIMDVDINNILDIDTNNGRIDGENIIAKDIIFETTNGLVTTEDLKADNITVNTTNGLIKANDCYSKNLTLQTTNGAITLNNEKDKEYIIENLDVDTVNGKETVNALYNNRK